MAIFHQIPKEIKERVYTHKGLYAYVVPIYLILDDGVDYEHGENVMMMAERNGIPMYSINIAKFVWKVLTVFHPVTPLVLITGNIDGSE